MKLAEIRPAVATALAEGSAPRTSHDMIHLALGSWCASKNGRSARVIASAAVLPEASASVEATRPSTWRRASATAVFTAAVIFCDTCWVRLGFLLSDGANARSEPTTV